jgi:hypothetical protein
MSTLKIQKDRWTHHTERKTGEQHLTKMREKEQNDTGRKKEREKG